MLPNNKIFLGFFLFMPLLGAASAQDIKMEIQNNLKKSVRVLASEIGSRSYMETQALEKVAFYIAEELNSYGYEVGYQYYQYKGKTYKNIITELKGAKEPENIFIAGAHYDTVAGTPGADDNASAVAGLLELARLLKGTKLDKTVRFVAFTLEEPPVFMTKNMGSYVYAKSLKDKEENIEGMICLEMIGYFTDTPGSQSFPLPFMNIMFPDTGNFIALVGNLSSKSFLSRVMAGFKKGTALPVESLSAPAFVVGVNFSDHWSFGKFGYNAVMVTDTAFYRNRNYHKKTDTPETLDYARMTEVVIGLKSAIESLAGSGLPRQK